MKLCELGKIRYPTREAARGVLHGSRGMVRRTKSRNKSPMNVFRCDKCGDFHVGHSGRRDA